MKLSKKKIKDFQDTIWEHYHNNGRHELPWRKNTSAYSVTVSEIMLQQTQVDRVIPFFKNWMKIFPNWKQLAQARQIEVLRAWKGLGYNSRALRLQSLAREVTALYSGRLPKNRVQLEQLPGIGPYTAGAIQAFANNEPEVFIETNIRRIFIHHFFQDTENISDNDIFPFIEETLETSNPREWYWALMDYGSTFAKKISNPNKKSKHYTRQSKFEGSDRQVRGKVLEILLNMKKISQDDLLKVLNKDKARLKNILQDLESEGFIKRVGGMVSIKE